MSHGKLPNRLDERIVDTFIILCVVRQPGRGRFESHRNEVMADGDDICTIIIIIIITMTIYSAP